MIDLFWKKRGLLLSAICVTALLVTGIVPKDGHSIPVLDTFQHRTGKHTYVRCEFFPTAIRVFVLAGKGYIESLHTDDRRSSAGKVQQRLQDTLSIDFIHSVPEPSTLLLVGSGLIGFALFARKRFRK